MNLFYYVALGGAILIVVLFLVERRQRRRESAKKRGVMVSPHTGGAYADLGEVIESELERIRAKETCLDKSHWKSDS